MATIRTEGVFHGIGFRARPGQTTLMKCSIDLLWRIVRNGAPFRRARHRLALEVRNADRADSGAGIVEQVIEVRTQKPRAAHDGEGDENQDESVFHRIRPALILGKTSDEVSHYSLLGLRGLVRLLAQVRHSL